MARPIAEEIPNQVRRTDNLYPSFPLHIFPPDVREALEKIAEYKFFSLNYLASSFLVACSAALDRKYIMKTPNNHLAFPAMWLIIVGNAGASKTGPQEIMFEPLFKETIKNVDSYENQMELAKTNDDEPFPTKRPDIRITSNLTTESVIDIISKQETGLLIYPDEILSWLNSMDAYRSKANIDKPFWLSAFNGSSYVNTRKTTGTTVINNINVSISGSIQNNLLADAFKRSEDASGFIDRFLFCCDNMPAPKWEHNKMIPSNLVEGVQDFVSELIDLESDGIILRLTGQAEKAMIEWQNSIVDEMEYMRESEVSAAKKDEIYINRLTLLMFLIRRLSEDFMPVGNQDLVDLEAVENAIELLEYFKENRDVAKQMIQKESKEVDYSTLEEEIDANIDNKKQLIAVIARAKADGVPVKWLAKKIGRDERTVRRWSNQG